MMVKKPILAIFLIIVCTLLISIGQIVVKIGANRLSFDWSILTNYPLIIGLFLFAIGSLFMIFSLRHGNLSLVHPLLSLSFVWASLLAFFFLKESFSSMKIIGIGIIIFGTFFICKGDIR